MKIIDFENRTYYLSNGQIYDDSFLEIPKCVSISILQHYYMQIDYHILEEDALLDLIIEIKAAELFNYCLNAVEFGLSKPSSCNFKKTVFPIVLSCYRLMGKPQEAIDYWKKNKNGIRDYVTAPLLTSLAAAHCDVKDYALAKKYANTAYALQGGKQTYENELSLLYQRIDKESNHH